MKNLSIHKYSLGSMYRYFSYTVIHCDILAHKDMIFLLDLVRF